MKGNKTKEQVKAQMKRFMAQGGYANNLRAQYSRDTALVVNQSNKIHLKAHIKRLDRPEYAIAEKLVRNFFIKHPNLILTKETIGIEDPHPFSFTASSSLSQIDISNENSALEELIDWNEFRVKELQKMEEEKERERQEQERR